MKVALVNPDWSSEAMTHAGGDDGVGVGGVMAVGSRGARLPIEYGYARALLEEDGHQVEIVDGHAERLTREQVRDRVAALPPDLTVVCTAPSCLWVSAFGGLSAFGRHAPRDSSVTRRAISDLAGLGRHSVVVGPHGSRSPARALEELGADLAVLGECEEVLRALGRLPERKWGAIPSVVMAGGDSRRWIGEPCVSDVEALPALRWRDHEIRRRRDHRHQSLGGVAAGPGAEVEASRGWDRKRPLARVLDELDGLRAQGVEYISFVDETFLPDRALLEALAARRLRFGVRTRIDLWSPEILDLLGRAGCVSIDAGVENSGSAFRRLARVRRSVPFVRAMLLPSPLDEAEFGVSIDTRANFIG
jgi:anaerobic magnesium-protoporphyrin IX monomethyl ester cyclase